MTQNKKQIRIQQKADNSGNWETNNPILMDKEIGYEKDTRSFKMGDGTTAWNSLDDFSSLYKGDHGSIYQTKSIMKSMMIKGFKITLITPNQTTIWLDTNGKSLETCMSQGDTITIKQGNKTYTATIVFLYTDHLNVNISTNDTIYADQSYVLSDKGYYYEDWDTTSENINASFNGAQATGKRSFAANSGKSTGVESFAEGGATISSGNNSHAEGYGTTASGGSGHAEGTSTQATNDSAHAEGKGTQANGIASHAEGFYATAKGAYSHAEGYQNIVESEGSHAEGYQNEIYGEYAHVEGCNNKVYSDTGHIEGRNNIIGVSVYKINSADTTNNTITLNNFPIDISSNDYGIIYTYFGNRYINETQVTIGTVAGQVITLQEGLTSYDFDNNNYYLEVDNNNYGDVGLPQKGEQSHAQGFNNKIKGNNSFIGGSNNSITSGDNSFVYGEGLQADSNNQFIIGKYNDNSDALFVIGNGTASNNRQNILEISDNQIGILANTEINGDLHAEELYVMTNPVTVFEGQLSPSKGDNLPTRHGSMYFNDDTQELNLLDPNTQNWVTIASKNANKLNKTTKFSISGGATASAVSYNGTQDNVSLNVSKLQDNYIQFAESGSIIQNLSYTSQLALDQFSANRMLGFKPDQLLFEYSNDGGTTWNEMIITDAQKMNFIYGNQIAGSLIALGASQCNRDTTNTIDPAKDMSRITLSPGVDLYAIIRKIQIQTICNDTLASGLKVEIQKRISDSWTSVCTSFLKGNAGWNDIFLNCTFGANNSTLNASWNAKEIRFIFSFSGLTSTNTTNLTYRPKITSISMFAPYLYDCTSSLFRTGKPYKMNNNRQVEFEHEIILPSSVGSFHGNLDGIANYANIATKAEKDLDGNVISETYLKKNNFNNVASNSFILRIDPDLYTDGHKDAQTAERVAYIPELKNDNIELIIACEYGTDSSYLVRVPKNNFTGIATDTMTTKINVGCDELGNIWAYSNTTSTYGSYVAFLVRTDVAQIYSLIANYNNMTLSPITSDQIDKSTCVFQLINYSGNDSNTKPTFNCSNTYTYTFNSILKGEYLFVLNTYANNASYIPTVTVSQNGTNNTSTEVLSHGKYVKIYCPITVSKDYESVTITITGICRGENLSRSEYGADPYLFANLSYDKINNIQAGWNELIYSSAGDNTMIFKYGTSGDLTIHNALDLSKSTYLLYEN